MGYVQMSDAVYEANLLREKQLVREVDDLRRSLMDSKSQLEAQTARALEAEKVLEWVATNAYFLIEQWETDLWACWFTKGDSEYVTAKTPRAALTDAWRKAVGK